SHLPRQRYCLTATRDPHCLAEGFEDISRYAALLSSSGAGVDLATLDHFSPFRPKRLFRRNSALRSRFSVAEHLDGKCLFMATVNHGNARLVGCRSTVIAIVNISGRFERTGRLGHTHVTGA